MNYPPTTDPVPNDFVFISYSSADREYVARLAEHLVGLGIPCWYDQDLRYGEAWRPEIERRILACAALIVVETPEANQSQWVEREVSFAASKGKAVLPVLLRGEHPFRLHNLRYENVTGGRMPGTAFVEQLRELCGTRGWYIPEVDRGMTGRDMLEPLVQRLTGSVATSIGLSTTLHGTGGFGKTVLALQACADPSVRRRYRYGVWVSVGRDTTGAALAEKINDVYYHLAKFRPLLHDPDQAGLELGRLLDDLGNVLLVVDDVWRTEQLRPFLYGGRGTCTRLVTTRQQRIVEDAGLESGFEVGELSLEQARALLRGGLADWLGGVDVTGLVARAGRWPLLLGLVRRRLAKHRADGRSATDAVAEIVRRLDKGGPTQFDLADEQSRERAVRFSVTFSLDLLSSAEQARFVELGIFAEDANIPRAAIALLWQTTGGLTPTATDELCDKIAELSLATSTASGGLRLHDVIRQFLRHEAGPDGLVRANRALLDAAAGLLAEATTVREWWRLPATPAYLWRHLGQHLAEADLADELVSLVTDLRWLEARLAVSGPAAAVADLDLATGTGDPTVAALRQALRQNADLLTLVRPRQALIDALAIRLGDSPALRYVVSAYRAVTPEAPRLEARWPMPDRPHPAQRAILTGHTAAVQCAAAPRGGSWLVTADSDGVARVWRPGAGVERFAVEHHAEILACAAAPDGAWLATAGRDGVVRMWDAANGQPVRELVGHDGAVDVCAVAPDGSWLVTAGRDGTARLWDTTTGAARGVLNHDDRVTACVVSPTGFWLATVGPDLRIWDPRTGERRHILATGPVTACAAARDGVLLATVEEEWLRIWDAVGGTVRHEFPIDGDDVLACAWAARTSSWLATAGANGTVRIWGVPDGPRRALAAHGKAVGTCVALGDGALATAGDDHTVRVWDPATGAAQQTLTGHTRPVVDCLPVADGTLLVSISGDKTVRIWDLSTESPADRGPEDEAVACVEASRGGWLASVGRTGRAQVRDPRSGELRHALAGHRGLINGCLADPDGSWLATLGADRSVLLWDAHTGELRTSLAGHQKSVLTGAVAPDGGWLATAGEDRTVRIWDPVSGIPLRTMKHLDAVRACAAAPDGRWLATVGDDQAARIWDPGTGRSLRALSHDGAVLCCAVAPDGTLATGGEDDAVRVWHPLTGDVTHTLSGHHNTVRTCAFGRDGRVLAVGDATGTLRIWDLTNGTLVHRSNVHSRQIRACVASDDGDWLAVAALDTVWLWDLRTMTAATAFRAKRSINSCLWLRSGMELAVASDAGVYVLRFASRSG